MLQSIYNFAIFEGRRLPESGGGKGFVQGGIEPNNFTIRARYLPDSSLESEMSE